MAPHFTTSYLEDALEVFHQSKKLAERAMEQMSEWQGSLEAAERYLGVAARGAAFIHRDHAGTAGIAAREQPEAVAKHLEIFLSSLFVQP